MKNKKVIISIIVVLATVICIYMYYSEPTTTIAAQYLIESIETEDKDVIIKDLQYYQEINGDIKYTIEISDMLMPITDVGNDKYFRRNIYNKKDSMGTLFIDEISGKDNMIIQGHASTKNEFIFTTLDEYLDKEYFDENPTFILENTKGPKEYTIIAVDSVNLNEGSQEWYQGEFINLGAKEDMITNFKQSAINVRDVEIDVNNQLVTLVTCNNLTSDGRYVIIATENKSQ